MATAVDTAWAKRQAWVCATALSPPPGLFDSNLQYHGPSPIGRQSGYRACAAHVFKPLARSFPDARKLPYHFLAGEHGGSVWTAATGNITGVMRSQWLGIPASDGPRTLRFGEFCRFEGMEIVEMRALYDIIGLAAQAGIKLLPSPRRECEVPPGPQRSAGVLYGQTADPRESRLTRDLVARMIAGCNLLDGDDVASQGMDRFWHEDMVWHEPWGVGSTYGLKEFLQFAQKPSVEAFPDRRGTWPKDCFVAEGKLTAFTGWPSLVGVFAGRPFRGIAPTGKPVGQTIMDFYVRDGDKLAENWVLIDLIKFASDCGVDLLARMPEEPEVPAEE